VAIAAALIREDVRYTIAGIARDLPKDVTALIGEAVAALDAAERGLVAAMSACAAEGFFLDLAAEVAGLDEGAALGTLQVLVARSLAEELDRTERRYRLHALVREVADGRTLRERHAEAVRRRFETWEANWRRCEQELADFWLALENSGDVRLANYSYRLTHRIGRLAEALEICERTRKAAEERQDAQALQASYGNQALILKAWGRLEEAMALHEKEETICLELGDKVGLQASYGNQALILKAWGRLGDAMALHQKEETICLELGDKVGLQASYGNQALILQHCGRLHEAMNLHQKEEAICRELADQDGLQVCLGNQAMILHGWDRLQEAMDLHKKEEAICLELGTETACSAAMGIRRRFCRRGADWKRRWHSSITKRRSAWGWGTKKASRTAIGIGGCSSATSRIGRVHRRNWRPLSISFGNSGCHASGRR
jgi:tetratricopeptide (TPR) repeat protein